MAGCLPGARPSIERCQRNVNRRLTGPERTGLSGSSTRSNANRVEQVIKDNCRPDDSVDKNAMKSSTGDEQAVHYPSVLLEAAIDSNR